MNEWQLQDLLTIRWIENPPIIHGKLYRLVAWELMFPSWYINYNKKKWNEPSIDFIAFDEQQTFLCIELKNEIKGQKALLSAYCQVLHRLHLLKSQYSTERMKSANDDCFDKNESYRIKSIESSVQAYVYPEIPVVLPILAARKFPKGSTELFNEWNSLSTDEFSGLVRSYASTKEFDRMLELNCEREQVLMYEVGV